MTDKINKKVIDIFTKKSAPVYNDEQISRCQDGYFFVCMKTDLNGKHFDEENLIKKANDCYYIVKVMMKQGLHPFIYNYKIPGDKILEFIELYIKGDKDGTIIEIDKFYPEDWA